MKVMKNMQDMEKKKNTRNMKKLLFIGNYGNRNIGDDAILHILSERYKKKYPSYNQYVVARIYPEDVRSISHAQPLTINRKTALWILTQCHLLVVGGGGIFSAYTGPTAKFIPLLVLVCKLLGKKVVYESIGFYATTPPFLSFMVRLSMLFADSVTVRDKKTYAHTGFVKSLKKVTLVEDPGFSIKPAEKQDVQRILKQEHIAIKSSKVIGISVKRLKDSKANARLQKELEKVVHHIIQHTRNEILFIPFCQDKTHYFEKDGEFAEEIRNATGTSRVHVLRGYYTPAEVAGVISICTCLIGMRFHSMVFAHALRIPLIPISYEEKCEDFIVREGYPLLNADSFNSTEALELIKKRYEQG